MSFHEAGVLHDIVLEFLEFAHLAVDPAEDVGDGLGGIATDPMQKGISGFHIQLDRRNAGSVLSAVMLLLHEQVELIDAPEGRAISLLIKRERFTQPDECKSALMFYFITHGKRRMVLESAKVS